MAGTIPNLEVHDVVVRQQPTFSQGGAIGQQVVVSYMVGDHGPFTLTYSPQEFTPEAARSAMDHQAVQLRRLLTGE